MAVGCVVVAHLQRVEGTVGDFEEHVAAHAIAELFDREDGGGHVAGERASLGVEAGSPVDVGVGLADQELAAPDRMTAAELREKYAAVFGEPAASGNRAWLARGSSLPEHTNW